MQRDTIAITDPTALMLPRRIGVKPFAWRRVAAVAAGLAFGLYLLVLAHLPLPR